MSYTAITHLQPPPSTTPPNQSTFSGTFTLIQSASTGQIKGLLNANGLVPLTRHAIHIHSFGDTSQFDTQIGPHFNPTNTSHGCPSSTSTTAFHLGDIGSFDVDSTGSVVNKAWTLTPNNISLINLNSPGFVLGRSIAIHEKEDDCTSQPAGNSGAKIAVGVVSALDYKLQRPVSVASAAEELSAVAVFDMPTKTGLIRSNGTHLSVSLSSLTPSSTYTLSLYPYGGSSNLPEPSKDICSLSNAFVTFKSDASGSVSSCLPIIPKNYTLHTSYMFGQAFLLIDSVDASNCKVTGLAPIGSSSIKKSDVCSLSSTASLTVGGGGSNVTSNSSGSDKDDDDDDDGNVAIVIPILALLSSIVLLIASVSFSCWKVVNGYRRLREDSATSMDGGGGIQMRSMI